jgi:tRNA nucleotidyltransferase (CCA-adding enzyme)
VIRALKLTTDLSDAIESACSLLSGVQDLVGEPPSRITHRLDRVSLVGILTAYVVTERERVKDLLMRYVDEWQEVEPVTTGHDLRDRGLPPGPRYSEILIGLRDAWLDGEIDSEEEELALLEEYLEE